MSGEQDQTASPTEPLVRAAGGIVTRDGANGTEVLVVHRPKYDDWSLPKGKSEGDESDEDTAVREVAEETGVVGRLGSELDTVRYTDARGRPKRVRYWHMTIAETGPFTPNDEIDECRWIPLGEVGKLLTYEHDRRLIAAFERLR